MPGALKFTNPCFITTKRIAILPVTLNVMLKRPFIYTDKVIKVNACCCQGTTPWKQTFSAPIAPKNINKLQRKGKGANGRDKSPSLGINFCRLNRVL